MLSLICLLFSLFFFELDWQVKVVLLLGHPPEIFILLHKCWIFNKYTVLDVVLLSFLARKYQYFMSHDPVVDEATTNASSLCRLKIFFFTMINNIPRFRYLNHHHPHPYQAKILTLLQKSKKHII